MQFQVTRLCPGRPKGDSQSAQGSEAGVKPDRMRALEQPQTHPAATTCPSPTLEELACQPQIGDQRIAIQGTRFGSNPDSAPEGARRECLYRSFTKNFFTGVGSRKSNLD